MFVAVGGWKRSDKVNIYVVEPLEWDGEVAQGRVSALVDFIALATKAPLGPGGHIFRHAVPNKLVSDQLLS